MGIFIFLSLRESQSFTATTRISLPYADHTSNYLAIHFQASLFYATADFGVQSHTSHSDGDRDFFVAGDGGAHDSTAN